MLGRGVILPKAVLVYVSPALTKEENEKRMMSATLKLTLLANDAPLYESHYHQL